MKIAILFGGKSFEHEISIVSAIALKKVLKGTLTFIFLDADGHFYHIPSSSMKSNHFSKGDYKKDDEITLSQSGFSTHGLFKSKKVQGIDVVLNLIHGAQGEDGTIAALLDFYSIKYISPRMEASVISFNKWLTKLYAKSIGVDTLEFIRLRIDEKRDSSMFDYPVIIKPLRLGSSIGVSIVKSADELDFALDVAFEFDDEVLIEPFVEGINEYNIAGCKANDWILSTIEAPNKTEFLDFEQKYMDFSRTESVQKADIDEKTAKRIQDTFKKVYGTMFEGALIRCDFFVKDDRIILNEINPIPGSMANYLFDDFSNVIDALASHLPRKRDIKPDYSYINKIQSAKGPKLG